MKRAVVLMNLGSPDSTSVRDVKRYLDEFLMDSRVIDKPWISRALLVKGIIVPFRAPKSAAAYRSIWTEQGSPLIVISRELATALQHEMHTPVVIAMRYGNPSPAVAFNELMNRHPELQEVILVPMYPHYAMSSYETAVVYAQKQHEKGGYPFQLHIVPPYYKEPLYISALTESMKPYLQQPYDHILFSYHGVPVRHIKKGDITGNHCLKPDCCKRDSPAHTQCYRHQCVVTTELAAQALQIPAEKYSMSFQSRLGREEWLQPYTSSTLEELPSRGVKRLLVVCPAFVSDCLETLEEIAEEGRHIFLKAGGEEFTMIPCLNTHPLWVQALREMIVKQFAENTEIA